MRNIYFAFTLVFILCCNTFSLNIFVNPTSGDDTFGLGTIGSPYKSLGKSGQVAVGGDTIFVRGGIHTGFQNEFRRFNTGSSRIYIMPYNNEIVILDGAGYNFVGTWQAIVNIQSSRYVTFQNFEIRNNNLGRGLRVVSDISLSDYIEIKNCKINNSYYEGISIHGSNILVENCEITNACMMNANFGAPGTHPVALSSQWHSSQQFNISTNITFKNNKVHDSWGEGIAFVRTDTFLCEGNKVYDCPYVLIYCDNAYNGIIKNNVMYGANTLYYENISGLFVPASGIFWAAEGNEYVLNRIVENITISNNLILKTRAAFGWFDDDFNNFANDSYRNISIYYNTVYYDIGFETFYIEPNINGIRVPPSNCKFRNNILNKATYGYITPSNDYLNYWEFTNNCFTDGNIPNGFQNNNFSGNPNFVNPSGYIPENYKLSSNSICKESGIPINGITTDFWNANRDNLPSTGFHEYGGINSVTLVGNEIPIKYALSQNYPNPFNPVTNITFDLLKESSVKLTVYDAIGKEVTVLVNQYLDAGSYNADWNAAELPSGIYFYKLEAESFVETKKMMLIK